MAMNRKQVVALVLMLAMLLGPSGAFPCAPMFPTAVFTLTSGPDDPYQNYLRGDLGVLQPGYGSFDLVTAYRWLTGTGLTPEEQAALLGNSSDNESTEEEEDWVKNWLDARNEIKGPGAPPDLGWHHAGSGITRIETQGGYVIYRNCSEDAFKTAVLTLNDRIRMFGKQGPEVIEWVKAQDIVFSNCSRGHAIPGPAEAGLPPLIKADRAYQIAAANFYSGDYDQAERSFQEIAKDTSSPWSIVAPYLAARSLIRNATMKAGYRKIDTSLMSQAETLLQSILKDKRLGQYDKPAQDLLGFVKARLRPGELMHELAQALVKKNVGPRLREYLQEYRYMLMYTDREVQKAAMDADDITDWVLTFRHAGPDALEHAIDQWEKTRSPAWLVAALSNMKAGHPKQQAVQTAADMLMPYSPAYQTAAYHSIRLLAESGKGDVAKRRLDALLSEKNQRFHGSSRNLLRAERMKLSANLDEFVQYALRTPAALGYGADESIEYTDDKIAEEYGKKKFFAQDSVRTMNGYLPASMLASAAARTALPEELRRQLAISAWMRAALLDHDQAAKSIAPLLLKLVPETEQLLKAYNTAQTKEERGFAASFLMLKYPGMKPYLTAGIGRTTDLDTIDNYHDNWWCLLGEEQDQVRRYRRRGLLSVIRAGGARYPGFLTKEEIQETEQEIEALLKIGSAPNYFAGIVLSWAEKKPGDPRVPEALHLLVKATRYGCSDKQTSAYSKAAHKLLHKRYPKDKWTKETPYYF